VASPSRIRGRVPERMSLENQLFEVLPVPDEPILIFMDESKPSRECPWLYIGAVFIRARDLDSVLHSMEAARSIVGYSRELHFERVSNDQKRRLAEAWLQLLMYDSRVHFVVNAVDTTMLSYAAFGAKDDDRVQARFARSPIVYGMKAFFGRNAVVEAVYCDKGNLEYDPYFGVGSLWRCSWDHDIRVMNHDVRFIDSDHQSIDGDASYSHLIQLADILVGCARLCMESTSGKQHKVQLATAFLPLVNKLTSPPPVTWRNSSFGPSKRGHMSFFPKRRLTAEELENQLTRVSAGFYTQRTPALSVVDAGSLFDASSF
jgi:hypothetical protein